MNKDQVFSRPRPQIVDFVFDETVAAVFPDMIRRSVPGYELVVPMTGLLAARIVRDTGLARVYDLGCSLGATTVAILKSLEALDVQSGDLRIIAVDNAAAMLEQARTAVVDPRVTFVEADIEALTFEPAAAMTMNWVLQFLPSRTRKEVLARIRAALADGGALLLSEKVRSDDPALEAFNFDAHLDFKRANGYSELEISQKRTALEQVMITDTIETHIERLHAAGFSRVQLWYQCLNWASFIAWR
jgi:tRNA (cmo5U34)-methyltransferase